MNFDSCGLGVIDFLPREGRVCGFPIRICECTLIRCVRHLGESPPPAPRLFLGREELVEEILGFVRTNTPVALIGTGGVGKTSIALTVLHHELFRQKFGDNRRFICCDEFPTSLVHFLSRLSNVIGAGIANPSSLAPLRPFLSSKPTSLIIDSAERILDPNANDAKGLYVVVDELSQFENICLLLTSRISTIPPHCRRMAIPTLLQNDARGVFDSIYQDAGQADPDIIDSLLQRLDHHTLSVTLLATIAAQNRWSGSRLAREWYEQRTGLLQTEHNESLAATVELSLVSPTFVNIGPDAHHVLEVIAFFPLGIDERKLEWVFPTVSDRQKIIDGLCVLSLTYRASGFITMLAPLRDYFRPKNPSSSALLVTTKDQYFDRLCAWQYERGVDGLTEAKWFVSEDINAEHLLDVFVSIDTELMGVWRACHQFLDQLAEYKPRPVILGPKINILPETHPFKANCVRALATLFAVLGDFSVARRLHFHELRLWEGHRNELNGAIALTRLADANRLLGSTREGIGQAEEALKIFERLEDKCWQGHCLKIIAWGYVDCRQLRGASRCVDRLFALLGNGGDKGLLRSCGRILATISVQIGNLSDAKEILESTLEVPLLLGDAHSRFWIIYRLAEVYFGLGDLDGVGNQITGMKSLAQVSHDQYLLGRAMELQAKVWLKTGKFAEARSEALLALSAYGKAGNSRNQEKCGELLKYIEVESSNSASKMELKIDGKRCNT